MTLVACVQYFAFCLIGTRKFLIGVGSWSYLVLSPVHGESQTSLPGNICLKRKIRVGVFQKPRLEWSVPQERQGSASQICLLSKLP